MTRVPKEVSDYMSRIGARGGLVGGRRSLETMTPEERQERARKASKAAAAVRSAKARAKRAGKTKRR